MKKYLLDTNAVSHFAHDLHGLRTRVSEAKRAGARVGTTHVVIAELFNGLEQSDTRDENEPTVEAAIRQLRIWPFELSAAREFGRLAAHLKRVGRPMQRIDIMIAAVALTIPDCTVVTTDGDLSAVPGLVVENWVS